MARGEKIRPRPRRLVWVMSFLALSLLYIPLFAVILYSFWQPGNGVSLQWYEKMLQSEVLLAALGRSFEVAFLSTLGATIIGTLGALAIERGHFPGRQFLAHLSLAPLVMPELVLGLSLLIWFAVLRLSLGLVSVVLAHITFCLSNVLLTVRARLQEFDDSIEDAARDLGATEAQVFWRITFPLMLPGIFSGALMAFALSFDDFLITFFTAGVGMDTLPIKLYSLIKFGVSPEIYALSALLIAGTLGATLLVRSAFLGGRMLRSGASR